MASLAEDLVDLSAGENRLAVALDVELRVEGENRIGEPGEPLGRLTT